MEPTEVRLARMKETLALIGSQPLLRVRMPQGILFKTLLCYAWQQVMRNKPSLKSVENGSINGVVAQLAERHTCTVKDVGSSPISSTS